MSTHAQEDRHHLTDLLDPLALTLHFWIHPAGACVHAQARTEAPAHVHDVQTRVEVAFTFHVASTIAAALRIASTGTIVFKITSVGAIAFKLHPRAPSCSKSRPWFLSPRVSRSRPSKSRTRAHLHVQDRVHMATFRFMVFVSAFNVFKLAIKSAVMPFSNILSFAFLRTWTKSAAAVILLSR